MSEQLKATTASTNPSILTGPTSIILKTRCLRHLSCFKLVDLLLSQNTESTTGHSDATSQGGRKACCPSVILPEAIFKHINLHKKTSDWENVQIPVHEATPAHVGKTSQNAAAALCQNATRDRVSVCRSAIWDGYIRAGKDCHIHPSRRLPHSISRS